MATQIISPKIGFFMNEGMLTEWLLPEGEAKEGQPFFAFESDKSVQEIEAPAFGTLKIVAKPGEVYQGGHMLGEIG